MYELKIVANTLAELNERLAELATLRGNAANLASADVKHLTQIEMSEQAADALADEAETETQESRVEEATKNKYTKKQAVDKAKEIAGRPYGEQVQVLLKKLDIKSVSAISVDKADAVIEGLEKMEAYYEAELAKEAPLADETVENEESGKPEVDSSADEDTGKTLDAVRAFAASLTSSGELKAADIKDIMKEVANVTKMSDLPPSKYQAMFDALNEAALG